MAIHELVIDFLKLRQGSRHLEDHEAEVTILARESFKSLG